MDYKDEIILVGNGPSILERELGSLIDSFGHVVRYNGACPLLRKHLIPNTGMKTHIHCINIITMHDLRRDFEIYLSAPELKTILLEPANLHSPQKGPASLFNPRNDGDWAEWKREFLDPHVNLECMFYSNCDGAYRSPDGKFPSMGLVSIFHYLKWYERVFLIGFDSVLDGISRSPEDHHYEGLPSDKPHYHNWEHERLIVKDLIEKDKVVVLSDVS